MIENILNGEELLAIIVRNKYDKPGITFVTPNEFSQQMAIMNHSKGHVISPHVHNMVKRDVHYTQEVLVIKKGKLRVDFYDSNKNYLESRILKDGDVILLSSGGHGFEVLEELQMVEVKQGPYVGEMDKTRFKGIEKESISIKGKEE